MKVLATAYACEPDRGSEAGIGWNWARQIARRHDLWLVTRENNVAAIEERAAAEGLRGLRVLGFDLPARRRAWKRGPRGAVLYFALWQRALADYARRLDREIRFDVVHHLTFASSWIASGLAELGRPFVWGPVGEHPRVPARFLPAGALRERGRERGKAFTRGACRRLDPKWARTFAGADVVLSLSSVFGDRLPAADRGKLRRMLAAGIEPAELPKGRFERGARLRVLFAGRLVELKGVRLALDAFARLAAVDREAELVLCGDGPARGALEKRARRHGLEDRVVFLGQRSHAETLARMRASDVFLFPSFEGGGMVVPEAMGSGCPVVCLDFGGPGEMTGDGRGVRVPLGRGPRDTAAALGEALIALARDEPRRAALAREAHRWAVAETTWDAKGERLEEIYAAAREHRSRRDAPGGTAA